MSLLFSISCNQEVEEIVADASGEQAQEIEADRDIMANQNAVLNGEVSKLLKQYHPPNAFILLMDGKSGDVLAWGQREGDKVSSEPTFMQSVSFPAASLSKIVTAAAALNSGKYTPQTEIPKIGRNSTLYKRQINPPENYSGNTMQLSQAFAISNNPVTAIVGIDLGAKAMQEAADALGFTGFEYPDSTYALAESACGFTKRNLISPLQAANAVRKLLLWQDSTFSEETYQGLHEMFLETVSKGTARKAMNKHVHSRNKMKFNIGGKTGSLNGDSPAGRYDWFAGFAQSKTDPTNSLVIVVMQAHGRLRYQHSSIVAALLINSWAKNNER